MKINLKENKNGITLIALIITIIVLLILEGVSIATLTGENGILNRTTNAGEVNDKASAREEIQLGVMASYGADGNVDNELIKENLSKINGIEGITDSITDESYPLEVTVDGKTFEIEKSGTVQNVNQLVYKSISEVFDANGKNETDEGYDANKLHIGDFVSYNAGTWTAEEIANVNKNGEKTIPTVDKPNKEYQFGGFTTGTSRNGNATPLKEEYNYVKDVSGNEITGWRVFDLDENNITLISAGCPEDFNYYSETETRGGYISEYILTGNKENLNDAEKKSYIQRDWSVYEKNGGSNARVLTKSMLENWYNKYIEQSNTSIFSAKGATEKFRLIYDAVKYTSLIDNYSFYWIPNTINSEKLYRVNPDSKSIWYGKNAAFGIRILVTLSNVKLAKTEETKSVELPNYDTQTYSVWKYR